MTATNIETSLVCDRQGLLKEIEARHRGLDYYHYDRIDMFWITLHSGGRRITFCVNPMESGKFTLTYQSGENPEGDEIEVASKLFINTIAYAQMCEWYQQLVDGGYFEDGQYPGKDTSSCPMCGKTYKCGTTHEHIKYKDQIVPHNGRQYKKIVDAGLSVRWRPGFSVDEKSLEDI